MTHGNGCGGQPVPDTIKLVVKLTRFAVAARYPDMSEAVTRTELGGGPLPCG
jgi:hypothetical protein